MWTMAPELLTPEASRLKLATVPQLADCAARGSALHPSRFFSLARMPLIRFLSAGSVLMDRALL